MGKLDNEQLESIYYIIHRDVRQIYIKVDEYSGAMSNGSFVDSDGIHHSLNPKTANNIGYILQKLADDMASILFSTKDNSASRKRRDELFLSDKKTQNSRYKALEVLFKEDEKFRNAMLRICYFRENGYFDLLRRKIHEDVEEKKSAKQSAFDSVFFSGATIVISLIPIIMKITGLLVISVPTIIWFLCVVAIAASTFNISDTTSTYKKLHKGWLEDTFAYEYPLEIVDLAEWLSGSYYHMSSRREYPISEHMEFVYPEIGETTPIEEEELHDPDEDDSAYYTTERYRESVVSENGIPVSKSAITADEVTPTEPADDKDGTFINNTGRTYTRIYCNCKVFRGGKYEGWYCPYCGTEIKSHTNAEGSIPMKYSKADTLRYNENGYTAEVPLFPFWKPSNGTPEPTTEVSPQFIHCTCGRIWGNASSSVSKCPTCNTPIINWKTPAMEAQYEFDVIKLPNDLKAMVDERERYDDDPRHVRYVHPRLRLSSDLERMYYDKEL